MGLDLFLPGRGVRDGGISGVVMNWERLGQWGALIVGVVMSLVWMDARAIPVNENSRCIGTCPWYGHGVNISEWSFCDPDVPENAYRGTTTSTNGGRNAHGMYPTPWAYAMAEQEARLANNHSRPYWDGDETVNCVYWSAGQLYEYRNLKWCSQPGGGGSCDTRNVWENYCPKDKMAADNENTGCPLDYEPPVPGWEEGLFGPSTMCPATEEFFVSHEWDEQTHPLTNPPSPSVDSYFGLSICTVRYCEAELGSTICLTEMTGFDGPICGSRAYYTGNDCTGTEDTSQVVASGGEGGSGEIALQGVESRLEAILSRLGQIQTTGIAGQVAVAGAVAAGAAAVVDAIGELSGLGGGGDGVDCDEDCPELEAVETYGTAASGFGARVQAAPIVAAIPAIVGTPPQVSCPSVESNPIDVLGGATLTIEAHCGLWANIAPFLSAIMMAVYIMTGAFIILRA